MKQGSGQIAAYLVTLAVAVILGLLYWQSDSADLRNRRHVEIMRVLNDVNGSDASLSNLLHQYRIERFHNFDRMHRLMHQVDDGIAVLRSPELGLYNANISGFDYAVNRYARAQLFRHELVEHYMRDIAILKNSLAFVFNSSSRAGGDQYLDERMAGRGDELTHLLHRLQREVLVVAGTRSPVELVQIESLLRAIRARTPALPAEARLHLDRLLQHSRLVLEYTAIVESVIAQIESLDPRSLLDEVEQRFMDYHSERLRATRHLRGLLYPLAGLAIFYLVWTLFRVYRLEENVWQQLRVADETLTSIDDAVIVVDHQARVGFLNNAATEITGWAGDEALGRPFAELVPLNSQVTLLPLQHSVEDCIERETTVRLSQRMRLENRLGQVQWIKFTASPLYGADHECRGAVVMLRRTRQPSELSDGHRVYGAGVVTERAVFESRLGSVLRRASSGRLVGALCYAGFGSGADRLMDCDDAAREALNDKVRKHVLGCMRRDDEAFAVVDDLEFAALLIDGDSGALMERGLELREQLAGLTAHCDGELRRFSANIGLILLYQTERTPELVLEEAREVYLQAVGTGEGLKLTEVAA